MKSEGTSQSASALHRLIAAGILVGLAATPASSDAGQSPATEQSLYSPSEDPQFREAYVDIDEWRDEPVRHRYVHGGFKGTDTRFSFYFPDKQQYQGRFFQYVTPVPDSETSSQAQTGSDNPIAFSVAAGAYFVETNGGGQGAAAGPGMRIDPSIGAYRANAAAAEYSRELARAMYGGGRPFGYIYGGSGGAYRTIGSMENTRTWDGAVPFVIGSPMAIPNGFTVRMHAMRVLWDKFPDIVDALDVGGSGDPYAHLAPAESDALREATRMGFPIQSWFGWKTMGVHGFTAVYPGMVAADPAYFNDFWTKPGYAGHDDPAQFAGSRIQFRSTVLGLLDIDQASARGLEGLVIPGTARGTADLAWKAQMDNGTSRPVAIQLAGSPPPVRFFGGDLLILSGSAQGKRLPLRELHDNIVTLGVVDLAVLAKLKPDDEVQVDNSNFLAAEFFHRHQVPGPEYPAYNQFRGVDGKPLFPQRPMLLGPRFAAAAAGTVPKGRFAGKMIVVESLWDREAYPWQADWYRQRVSEHLGAATEQHLRIWMTDRALHGGVEDPTRVVSYVPMLQQALRDVAAWVEQGKAPPASTNYIVDEGVVSVPGTAAARRGIQPVVTLRVNGGQIAKAKPGTVLWFTASAEVPPGAGRIVAVEWDFGNKQFEQMAMHPARPPRKLQLQASRSFTTPGTYFPVVRVYSERDGKANSPFARVYNLARVRVVVE